MVLQIRQFNKQAYADIIKDIQKHKNAVVTFQLLINAGNIVEYTITEQKDYKDAK